MENLPPVTSEALAAALNQKAVAGERYYIEVNPIGSVDRTYPWVGIAVQRADGDRHAIVIRGERDRRPTYEDLRLTKEQINEGRNILIDWVRSAEAKPQ